MASTSDGSQFFAVSPGTGIYSGSNSTPTYTPTITVTGSPNYTYTGSELGPDTSDITGETGQPDPTGAVTYSYSGRDSTTYGPSATAPTNAGTYSVTATIAADTVYEEATSAAFDFSITKAYVEGTITVSNKEYDGNTSASVTGHNLTGVASGDDVSLTGGTASFNNADVGTDKFVFLAGPSLAGADADNYQIAGDYSFNTKADITPKPSLELLQRTTRNTTAPRTPQSVVAR